MKQQGEEIVMPTFASCSISSESLFASTAIRTLIVGTFSVLVTWTGIRRALIDI